MNDNNLTGLINNAFQVRSDLIEKLDSEETDIWRIFHGINEGRPGLTIDRYGKQVLIRSFRQPLSPPEIEEIKSAVSLHFEFSPLFVYHDRSGKNVKNIPQAGEKGTPPPLICREIGVKYWVPGLHQGQDPFLFIDLRAGRRFVMRHCKGKSLLNLFAYTCGVGTSAAAAGARQVWNVDFALSGLNQGRKNANLNRIPGEKLRFIHQDVFPVIRQLAGLGVKGKARRRKFLKFKPGNFDIVFMDPPTWAASPFGAVDIVRDYQGLFKPALLCVKPGGMIISTNHAPEIELAQWLEILERCTLKAGKQIKQIRVIEPETDFPSPDKKFPLKIAAILLQ